MADTVLLLHGFTTSARRTWQEPGWIDLLGEAGRTVLAPDLLGHGQADKPHDPASYAHVEDQIAALLPPGRPVDAIGYSAGARILLVLAAQDPGRFHRLVLGGVGARLLQRRDDQDNPLAAAIESADQLDPTDVVSNHFVAMATSNDNDPKALAAFLRRDQPRLDAEHLAGITTPSLIVIGDRDFAGPGQPLADSMANCEVKTLRNVDHFGLPKAFGFMDAAFRFLDIDPMG